MFIPNNLVHHHSIQLQFTNWFIEFGWVRFTFAEWSFGFNIALDEWYIHSTIGLCYGLSESLQFGYLVLLLDFEGLQAHTS